MPAEVRCGPPLQLCSTFQRGPLRGDQDGFFSSPGLSTVSGEERTPGRRPPSLLVPTRQKYRCSPSWMVRLGIAVEVMVPKFPTVGSEFGEANCGWLSAL
jgi:hypothetical protein